MAAYVEVTMSQALAAGQELLPLASSGDWKTKQKTAASDALTVASWASQSFLQDSTAPGPVLISQEGNRLAGDALQALTKIKSEAQSVNAGAEPVAIAPVLLLVISAAIEILRKYLGL